MRDVVCEVEDQGRLLKRNLDEVILSSRRREQAEGMALQGHDGVSSLLPAPWWAHRGVQTEGLGGGHQDFGESMASAVGFNLSVSMCVYLTACLLLLLF